MILGIVSDTHGHCDFAAAAARMLESLDVETVIHCGDIGSIEIVRLFSRWPTHFVLGNVDSDAKSLQAAIHDLGGVFHGRFGALQIDGLEIAFLHGDDERLLTQTIAGGKYDLVCYGHTHVAEQHQQGRTLVVNPGALYRTPRHSIAIARLPEIEVVHVAV